MFASRNRFWVLAPALAIVLAACSGNSAGTLPGAASGGAAAAPNAYGPALHASFDARAVAPAPNRDWAMVPGTLSAHFVAPPRQTLHLTIPYPASREAAILRARAPVVTIAYADGRTLRYGPEGRFDTIHHTVAVDVPAALLRDAVSARYSLGVDAAAATSLPTGPRYWNGSSWSATGTVVPNERTLVLVHGIFSDVESTFTCAQSIASAGGYQQVLGFDYDYSEPPSVEGPLLAAFLNSLAADGVTSLDVEAHSYGSVIAYAALPSVSAGVSHVVTLGGPLPLRGDPLADAGLLRTVLVALADVFVGPPSVINNAYDDGMVASLATDSSAMQSILSGVKGRASEPKFVQVAGTSEYAAEALLYPVLYWYIDYPWDGVVEKVAAQESDVPSVSARTSFALDHTQLPCASSVISYVGSQVK
ncbi:MAG TPA: hypothetical protein VMH02_11495 [Verrucomicrobiae bacterium]|nr:hypothetical protein [Verrucomicrobiae bacterium]